VSVIRFAINSLRHCASSSLCNVCAAPFPSRIAITFIRLLHYALGVLLLLMEEEFNERAVNERLSAAALRPLMCATFSYRKMIVKGT
jgi:hypothetical protein